ncbi:hypothetical protein HZS_7750, partial [Henneguya salminicola]
MNVHENNIDCIIKINELSGNLTYPDDSNIFMANRRCVFYILANFSDDNYGSFLVLNITIKNVKENNMDNCSGLSVIDTMGENNIYVNVYREETINSTTKMSGVIATLLYDFIPNPLLPDIFVEWKVATINEETDACLGDKITSYNGFIMYYTSVGDEKVNNNCSYSIKTKNISNETFVIYLLMVVSMFDNDYMAIVEDSNKMKYQLTPFVPLLLYGQDIDCIFLGGNSFGLYFSFLKETHFLNCPMYESIIWSHTQIHILDEVETLTESCGGSYLGFAGKVNIKIDSNTDQSVGKYCTFTINTGISGDSIVLYPTNWTLFTYCLNESRSIFIHTFDFIGVIDKINICSSFFLQSMIIESHLITIQISIDDELQGIYPVLYWKTIKRNVTLNICGSNYNNNSGLILIDSKTALQHLSENQICSIFIFFNDIPSDTVGILT